MGQIYGNLVCKKVSTQLKWQTIFKTDDFVTTDLPNIVYVQDGSTSFFIKSKSKAFTKVSSTNKDICEVKGNLLIFKNIGICKLQALNPGDYFTNKSNTKFELIIKTKNFISIGINSEYKLTDKEIILPKYSSAKLTIDYDSITKSVCDFEELHLKFNSHGLCTFNASQLGDQFTDHIDAKTYSFKIIRENVLNYAGPTQLSLGVKAYLLDVISSSGLQVTYKNTTPEVCLMNGNTLNILKIGNCLVLATQAGDEFTFPASDLQISIAVTSNRVTTDQPDAFTGYQIKPIYVVPSDGIDHQYDINGYLTKIMDEGNNFLQSQIGVKFQIDKIASGYDFQYFKSRLNMSYMLSASNLQDDLYTEMGLAENPSLNRKNYIFFVDVDSLKNGSACGYASRPGFLAVVALGGGGNTSYGSCTSKSGQINNFTSLTWTHESFHNLGVEHTSDDSCDFMRGTGNCNSKWTIDNTHTRYVGSEVQGVNVLSLRVWEGHTSDQNLRASCILNHSGIVRRDGMRYALCPTGTQVIGALNYCWSSINSTELQVMQNGNWVSLGNGNFYNAPWGKYINWSCSNSSYSAPWMQITVTIPGIQKYRWLVNGRESEQFMIYWQN